MAKTTTEIKYLGTGRRKSAVARVFLRPGQGKIAVNDKTPEEYFGGRALVQKILNDPWAVASIDLNKFDVFVRVHGGGYMAQAGAISLGISRALVVYDEASIPEGYVPADPAAPTVRALLKASKKLRRDSRRKERKKYGLKGARKREQYSKR